MMKKRIIWILFVVVCVMSCKSKNEVSAQDGDVFVAKTEEGIDMLFKIISVAEKTVQVGIGDDSCAVDKRYSGPITIPKEINTYKVISIAKGSFMYCMLSSVVIPEGVTIIKEHAFGDCHFLNRVIFPSTLTTIEEYAFVNTSLNTIHIPKAVSFIGEHALRSFETSSIEVEEGNKYYDSRDNCNAIIESSTNKLIVGCKNTNISHSIVEIGNGAYTFCKGLYEIEIPSNIKTIGKSAFSGCKNLQKVIFTDGLQKIDEYAFFGSRILSLYIPKTVMEINEHAFGRTMMHSIRVDNGNSRYDSRNNCNAIIETSSDKLIAGCINTVIPENVKIIGKGAFSFNDIENIVFPESINEIEEFAFDNCKTLNQVVSKIKMPFEVSWAFVSINKDAILYVPAGTKEKYTSTKGWDKFNNIIEL